MHQGDQFPISLQKAIQNQVAYVILFVSADLVKSEWVKTELEWALEREKSLGRQFLLPVRLPDMPIEMMPDALRNRYFLEVFKWEPDHVERLARQAVDHLLGLLILEHEKFPPIAIPSGRRLLDGATKLFHAASAYPEKLFKAISSASTLKV